jgi:NAD(P)H-binding
MSERHCVFIAGGTGYMGRKFIPRLLQRGHEVRALVRRGSESKLPTGCTPVLGDALDGKSYAKQIAPADTFVQLVGVAHPSPAKAAEFRKVDLVAGLGGGGGGEERGDRALCVFERGTPGADDEGVHRGAGGVRGSYRGGEFECDNSAAVVCARSGTSVAVSAGAGIQAGRAVALDSRGSAAAGTGDVGTDDACTYGGGGESGTRKASYGSAGNSPI